jgi:hypothetical protein
MIAAACHHHTILTPGLVLKVHNVIYSGIEAAPVSAVVKAAIEAAIRIIILIMTLHVEVQIEQAAVCLKFLVTQLLFGLLGLLYTYTPQVAVEVTHHRLTGSIGRSRRQLSEAGTKFDFRRSVHS